eukprot:CAMPEP_0118641260 /NCGR_PEP_ID=MMETSP0785-20121206/5184_1 /TAXON_ID=91992 /ORGANISM="Bolidomonas pacifica, Strain CCMP 1866" /LENGTH=1542 /DNA_ID=CAMNT_0006532687 /DNA_START=89 /DNA_END=4714 /DNA_ORIENTATION=+
MAAKVHMKDVLGPKALSFGSENEDLPIEHNPNIAAIVMGVKGAQKKFDCKLRNIRKTLKKHSSNISSSSLLNDMQNVSDPFDENTVLPELLAMPGFRYGTIKFQGCKREPSKKQKEEASAAVIWKVFKAKDKLLKESRRISNSIKRSSSFRSLHDSSNCISSNKADRKFIPTGDFQDESSFKQSEDAFTVLKKSKWTEEKETDYSNIHESKDKKYMRIPSVSSMETKHEKLVLASGVYYHLLRIWKERPPGLIVSVVGTASHKMNLVSRFFKVFSNDLHHLLDKTQAWVIDSGIDKGISQVLGVIRNAQRLKCPFIGVVTAGLVKGNVALNGGSARYPIVSCKAENEMNQKLDSNHSHYILVDEEDEESWLANQDDWSAINSKQNSLDSNGSLLAPQAGAEFETRMMIEDAIRTLGEHKAIYIPSITIVCGGGKGALLNVHASLSQRKPVIILKESGRIVDALVHYMERGGHVNENADLNKNGIEDDIEEELCEAIYALPTEELDGPQQIEFDDLMVKFVEISKLAVKEHLLTVYDVEDDMDLLKTCLVAIEGTDASFNAQCLLAAKWSMPDLATELLENLPVDMTATKHFFAKDRLKWCKKISENYDDDQYECSSMMQAIKTILFNMVKKDQDTRIETLEDVEQALRGSHLLKKVSPHSHHTLLGSSDAETLDLYVEHWINLYANTQDEVVAYSAFRNDGKMVRNFLEHGYGSVIMDALIRVEMQELFQKALVVLTKGNVKLDVSDDDYDEIVKYMKVEVQKNNSMGIKEFESYVYENRQKDEDNGKERLPQRTSTGNNSRDHIDITPTTAMVRWDKIFFTIYSLLRHEIKELERIDDATAERRLKEFKKVLMAKALIYTRLLPIHSKSKLDITDISEDLISKTAISFIHQYKANEMARRVWVESQQGGDAVDVAKPPHIFKLHPIHHIWWALLSARAEFARQVLDEYTNVPAAIMMLSRSGFTNLCIVDEKAKKRSKNKARIWRKLFMDLTSDLSLRLFRRLGDINEVRTKFTSEILPKFVPGVVGPEGLLCGDPENENETLLECLLFVGLPRGKDGETLCNTLSQLSQDSKIGSLGFLEAMMNAPKASQASEILDNIIDHVWYTHYQSWWIAEAILFLFFFFLNMFLLSAEPSHKLVESLFASILVTICNSYFLLKELVQMSVNVDEKVMQRSIGIRPLVAFREYFIDGTNSMDFTAILLGFIFPILRFAEHPVVFGYQHNGIKEHPGLEENSTQHILHAWMQVISSVVIFLNLGRLLFTYSKGIEKLSWLVVVIQNSIADMVWFLGIMLMSIIAFGFIFRIIIHDTQLDCGLVPVGEDDDPLADITGIQPDCDLGPFSSISRAIISTFQLVFMGAYEEEVFINLEEDPLGAQGLSGKIKSLTAWSWYFLLVVNIVVVSLNAMIALLGESFARINEGASAQKRMDRLELIVEYFKIHDAIISSERMLHHKQQIINHLHEETNLVGFISDVLVQRSEFDSKFNDFDINIETRDIKEMVLNLQAHFDDLSVSRGDNKSSKILQERKELIKLVEGKKKSKNA